MHGTMTEKKHRVVIKTDSDELRLALRAEAADRGMEMSQLAEQILRQALVDAIDRNRKKRKDEGRRR